MKSRINTLADYREALVRWEVPISPCPEEHIQAQLRHLTRPFKRTEPVQALEKGDVAVLSLCSELPKYNKPTVFVTVGGGLFDKDFEEKLAGRSVGESFDTDAESKRVQVTVRQASRTVFPEPTDEMAAAYAAEHEEFQGVTTVAAYREKVREDKLQEEKQNAFFNIMEGIMEYVMTHSEFDFDEGEVEEITAQIKEEIGQELGEGEDLASIGLERLRSEFGIDSLEALEKEIRHQAEWAVATDLWLAKIHGVESVEDIEGYPYKFLDDYVRENLKFTEEK